MATNAVLNVLLQAKDQMSGALRSAGGGLTRFSSQITAVSTGLLAIGQLSRVFGDVISGMKDVVAEGDRLAKLSLRLGITASALDDLGYAAERQGTNLERLTVGLQQMGRNVQDAADGLGEAKDTLDDLGLSAEVLAGLSLDEQFRLIGEAIAGMEGEQRRVAASMKIFGRSGAELTQIFNAQKGTISGLMAENRSLNGWTDEQAEAMARAADQGTRLSKAFSAVGRAFTTELMASITDEDIDRLTTLASILGKIAGSLGSIASGPSVGTGLAFGEGVAELFAGAYAGAYASDPSEFYRQEQARLARQRELDRLAEERRDEARMRGLLARPDFSAALGPMDISSVTDSSGKSRFVGKQEGSEKLIELFDKVETAGKSPDLPVLRDRLEEIAVTIPRDAETELSQQIALTKQLGSEFGANVVGAAFRAVDAWATFAADAILTGENVFKALEAAAKSFLREVLAEMLALMARKFAAKLIANIIVPGSGAAVGAGGPAYYVRRYVRRPELGLAPADLRMRAPMTRGGGVTVLDIQINAGFGSRAEGESIARTVVDYARSAGALY